MLAVAVKRQKVAEKNVSDDNQLVRRAICSLLLRWHNLCDQFVFISPDLFCFFFIIISSHFHSFFLDHNNIIRVTLYKKMYTVIMKP